MTDSELVSTTTDPSSGKKLRRITRACDYCHKRSIRCVFPGASDSSRCQNCIDFDQACRFDREVKRRGVKPRNQGVSPGPSTTTSNFSYEEVASRNASLVDSGQGTWSPVSPAPASLVSELIEIYFELLYPYFPYFHRPNLRETVNKCHYLSDRYTFASIMGLCALVTAALSDSSSIHPHWNLQHLKSVSSASFYMAAARVCSETDISEDINFDLLRANATLTLTAIEYGKTKEAQAHLGRYRTMVDVGGFHTEKNWPIDIGIIQREEWRRLHWAMYAVDVWRSITWHTQIRVRERQADVAYPTEIDDDHFDDTGYNVKSSSIATEQLLNRVHGNSHLQMRSACWLYGWNFTIELFRLLEHICAHYGPQQTTQQPVLDSILQNKATQLIDQLRSALTHMYSALPQHFKENTLTQYGQGARRYSVQTISIKILVILIQILLAKASHSSVQELCDLASEVTNIFTQIDPSCGPLQLELPLSQLASVGELIASVVEAERPLSGQDIFALHSVLTSVIHILEESDVGTGAIAPLGKLKATLLRLESAAASQIEHRQHPSILHSQTQAYNYGAPQTLQPAVRTSEEQGRAQALQHSTNLSHNNPGSLGSVMSLPLEQSMADPQFPLLSQTNSAHSNPRADPQQWPQIWGYDYSRFSQGPPN